MRLGFGPDMTFNTGQDNETIGSPRAKRHGEHVNDHPHPLTIPSYRWFLLARLLAVLGQSNFVVVLGWAVYDAARLTLDMRAASFRIGLIGLAQFLPVLLLNPVSGLVADRFDRRLVVRLSLTGQMLAVLALFAAEWSGAHGSWLFYASAAAFASSRAFYMPAMNALGPALVPIEVLPRAIAFNTVGGRIGAIIGPVLGGFAYGLGGAWAYGLTSALIGLSIAAQCMVGTPLREVARANGHPIERIVEGLQYVMRTRMLLGAISLDLFAVLFGGATALLPAYARDVLHVGPSGLGLLRAAASVGSVGTALWISVRPVTDRIGPKMLGSVVVFGLATVVFGLSTSLWLSLAMLVLLGAADMISVYIRQTLVQVITPDPMRGRVGATSSLFWLRQCSGRWAQWYSAA